MNAPAPDRSTPARLAAPPATGRVERPAPPPVTASLPRAPTVEASGVPTPPAVPVVVAAGVPDGAVAAPPPAPTPRLDGEPVPIARAAGGFLGLASAPYVEGDFVAGVRRGDGRWVVVSPRAEGFPDAWRRRVALWFVLSLLAVAPVAWLFARRIVVPLDAFARAADLLGRDPAAAVLPLRGPAEVGRAEHAFNQMRSRLRSFVDDRTAMIDAISHDLRTPPIRLRFRIEDVPGDQQDALRDDVVEMKAMIASVIAFMRAASIPNPREQRDLAELVDDVVETSNGATALVSGVPGGGPTQVASVADGWWVAGTSGSVRVTPSVWLDVGRHDRWRRGQAIIRW